MSFSVLDDLTNKVFGDWTVLYRAENDSHDRTRWHCRCACGVERDVCAANLKRGLSTGCGCRQRKTIGLLKTKDISGQIFGYIKPIRRTGSTKQGGSVWECICMNCGKLFTVSSNALLNEHQIACGCIRSIGEKIIKEYLDKHHIQYQSQKRFIGCKDKTYMPFDFYLTDYNIAIEYDGEYHYRNPYNDEQLAAQHKRDAMKTLYCDENDIQILRIPYWEKDNIESILNDWLFLLDAEESNVSCVDLSA